MEAKKILNAGFIEKIKKVGLGEAKEMLESEILEKELNDYEVLELKLLPFVKVEKIGNNNYVSNILYENDKIKIELK